MNEMYTRWGRDLEDPPLDDYPRPQLRRAGWLNLNGAWSYAVTPRTSPQPDQWQGTIRVPFCIESALSGVGRRVTPQERLWYRRSIKLTEEPQIRRLLHFGAVDYECALWINGALVGAHKGGFDPFSFDINDYVVAGENEIVLGVVDATNRGDQMRGKQHLNPQRIWYTPVTGIWQTVWLEEVPLDAHIDEVKIETAPDCDAIDIAVFLYRPSRDPTLAALVEITLDNKRVHQRVIPLERRVRIEIDDPQLWSPDTPTLYDVEVSLLRIENPMPEDNEDRRPAQLLRRLPLRGESESARYADVEVGDEEPLDKVATYFGLRTVSIDAHSDGGHPSLFLNGKPIFHLGPLDQGWWPDGLHTPPADGAIIYEIEFLKQAGFNTLRKHIKVEPARYYYHCDRLGILVWQDVPSGFLPAQFVAPNDEGEGLRNQTSTEQFEAELQRIVNRLRQFPSIVMWVLHNEGWGQFDTARLVERLRSLHPGVLINANSGWLDVGAGDVIDRHDYDPSPQLPTPDGKRALVIGEYGGVGWPIAGHLWNAEMENWGYQTLEDDGQARLAYEKVTSVIVEHAGQGLAGAIYTQTTDVEGEVNGLLTYDREIEKFSRAWLAELHAPLTRSKG
ncbi:MAG: glycoside hydrolase family 2 TIM barrel-domain containing protein [Pseudomonadales bacterium]